MVIKLFLLIKLILKIFWVLNLFKPKLSRALHSSSVLHVMVMNLWIFIIYQNPVLKSLSHINSSKSIVIVWWREQSPRNYSLVINKLNNVFFQQKTHSFIVSFNIYMIEFWKIFKNSSFLGSISCILNLLKKK